ncbi:glycosyltransferase family 2 protein [Solirubrobacter soli]|uniref:glycosyltransferase family 2 protein n=1 Tax=Solirubrobacter soli TaxID=363832 RepID=UPI00069FED93|nr:glycosyltransferase family 2 protein [Solirubrobacter soli]
MTDFDDRKTSASPAPLVSVVIPVHNGSRYILAAVNSVLQQSHTCVEVIVVDDGSTDDTDALVSSIEDSRLCMVSIPTRAGVAAARNHGLRRATGDYVAWLDADDTWYDFKVSAQVAILEAFPRVVCVGSPMEAITADDSRTIGRVGLMGRHASQAAIQQARVMPFPLSSSLARGDAVRAIAGFDERLDQEPGQVEDLDFIARLARLGDIRWLPMSVGGYRVHPNSSTSLRLREQQAAAARIQSREARDERSINGGWTDSRRLRWSQAMLRRSLEDRSGARTGRALIRIGFALAVTPSYAVRKLSEFVV